MTTRKLIAVSEEEVERLRLWADYIGADLRDPKSAIAFRSIADRYEDGITEEEAIAVLSFATGNPSGDRPRVGGLGKLAGLAYPDTPGGTE